MNKYQLAMLAIQGRQLGKKLFSEKDDDDDDGIEVIQWDNPYTNVPGYEEEKEDQEDDSWQDNSDWDHTNKNDLKGDVYSSEKDRKNYYAYRLSPDSIMSQYGHSSQYTTFAYSSATNTLFCDYGYVYHGDVIEPGFFNRSKLKLVHKEPKGSKFLFGRFGETRRGGGFVTIWNTSNDEDEYEFKTYHQLPLGNHQVLKDMLTSMVNGTVKVVGKSPAKLPITTDYVYTDVKGKASFVSEIIGGYQNKEEDICSKIAKINVGGKELSLGAALGNLHMVKGQELDLTKSAVCNNFSGLKKQLLQNKCPQSKMLDDLIQRIGGCSSDKAAWDNLKQGGAFNYRMDLKKVFSNPEEIDKQFRGRQKDIDAAWDFMNKRESRLIGFKTWIEDQK